MIKSLRKDLGLSQADLAKNVGVSRQTMNAIENGRYSPTLDMAYKITEVLNKKCVEEIFIKEEDKDQ